MSGCDKSIDEVPLCPYRELDEFRNRVCRKDEGTRCPGADAPTVPDFVPPHEQGVIVVLAEPPTNGTPEEQAEWCQDLREALLESIITCAGVPFVTNSKNIAGGGALAPDCLNFIIGADTVPIRQWAAQHKRLRWEAHEPFGEPAGTPPVGANNHLPQQPPAPARTCDKLLATSCPWRELQADRTLRCNAAAGQGCRADESAPTGALAAQVGGDHYKSMKIQPVEYIHRNGLGFIEGCVIKYVSRWRAKNGIQDLEKARHFINLLIELESKK